MGAGGSGAAEPSSEQDTVPALIMAENTPEPEELDPSSAKFDSQKAIYSLASENLVQVKSYDSVEQCIKAIFKKPEMEKSKPEKPEPEKPVLEKLERRFLPEQMPVPSNRKDFRHVLARMEEYKDGPMGQLR